MIAGYFSEFFFLLSRVPFFLAPITFKRLLRGLIKPLCSGKMVCVIKAYM